MLYLNKINRITTIPDDYLTLTSVVFELLLKKVLVSK